MREYTCYLVSVLSHGRIFKCALKTREWEEHYQEAAARERIHAQLPSHIREMGPVVDVEEIFEVEDKKKASEIGKLVQRWNDRNA